MNRIFKPVPMVLALGLCFSFGFVWGDVRARRPVTVDSLKKMFVTQPVSVAPERIFKETYTRVIASYYRPVKSKNLTYAGVSGMMGSLGDPHTIFLPPVAAKEFDTDTRGRFVGIGAKLDSDVQGAKIASVFDDGPALTAGIKSGDIIVSVDGKSVAGKDVLAIVAKIRGEEGTTVRLGILKAGQTKPIILAIRRTRVNTPTVEHVVLKDTQIGLMTIHQFAEPTSAQFDKAIESLAEQQIKGLVIDLRDNPGGLLQSDIEMLSRFVSDKVVVTIKSRDGIEEVPKTYANQTRRWPFPIAVIMNEDTASAAEIFAGALQDYRLATLVGVHSYGKASVQNLWPLRDGSSAKITIGRYYLPSGNDIGRKVDEDGQFLTGGLQPDVRVENDPDDTNIELGNPAKDPQLKKAIEVLQAKK